MISSPSNPQVKQVVLWQKKAEARREDGIFLAEGLRLVAEAPGSLIRQMYISEACERELSAAGSGFSFLLDLPHEIVTDGVFSKMSSVQAPQGVLAVLKRPAYGMEELLQKKPLTLLLLEDLQDPGNLGTILRTGEGAGIGGVILSKGCVDIFSPKVVRGTMGAIYRVPFVEAEDLPDCIRSLQKEGVKFYAAHLKGRESYTKVKYPEATCFMIGNEGNGLTEGLASLADGYVKIPMEGQVESLNAAVAASLLMYERKRQEEEV